MRFSSCSCLSRRSKSVQFHSPELINGSYKPHSCFGLHRFPPAPSTVRVTVPRCRLCRISAEHVEYWTSTLYFLACHRTTRCCRHCSLRSHSTRTRGIHDDGRIESLCYTTTLAIPMVSYTRPRRNAATQRTNPRTMTARGLRRSNIPRDLPKVDVILLLGAAIQSILVFVDPVLLGDRVEGVRR